jgi:vancomycin resistance protein YoaR
VRNIHTIADIVSGTVILPGKTFDLNGIVGERDTARGFVSAPMIEGQIFTESVGGGVSQFATTTFNAAFFAGYPIAEYQTHSYYISRYPAGREATVSWPKPDLKWVNDSRYGALVTTSYTGTSVTVTIWSTKRYDVTSESSNRYNFTTRTDTVYNTRSDCEPATGEQGFDIDVWRVFKQGGVEIKRQKFHTRYLSEPVIVCGPKPTPKPTPTPTKTPTPTGTPTPAKPPTPTKTAAAAR